MSGTSLPPGTEKYELLRPLGRGGMGEVYLGRDRRLGREVAIKYLRRDLPADQWHPQLEREAQLLAQLNHPNIVQVYDIFEQDDSLALVMEYVAGRNLHIHLRESRPDLGQKLLWLSQVADGLAASHRAGISHCDLKAENVLICPDGTAKVTDFGIAQAAPDYAADMLALGELGQRLLSGESLLSPSLQYLLERLTDSRAGRRPDSAAAAQELRQAWHEQTQAETPLPEQLGPPAASGRRRVPLLLALAALVGVISASIAWWPSSAQREYVAVLPTTFVDSASLSAQQQQNLRATVQQALQESVVASRQLALVSARAQPAADASLSDQALALGANTLLASTISCGDISCDLTLQRIAGEDGAVTSQRSLTLLTDSPLESHDTIQRQWHRLFAGTEPLAGAANLISEEDYRLYLELRQANQQNAVDFRPILAQLAPLLERAERFLPLYLFYARMALGDFQMMGDIEVLEQLDATLRQAEKWAPDSLYLARARFRLAVELGDMERARALLDTMESVGADELLLTSLYGELFYGLQQYDEAAPYYARAVTLRPSIDAMYAEARNYFFAGHHDKALQAADALLARYPDYVPALGVKGVILLEQGRFDEAVEVHERSLSLQPDDPLTRANLALVYMVRGEYHLSREQLLVAFEKDSRDPVLVLNLADAEALLGNTARAEELYRGLVERGEREHMVVAPWVMSQAYAQLGEHQRALAILREIDTAEQGPESAFSAALVYTLAGQHLSALVELESALQAGMGSLWFELPWFDALCAEPRFIQIMSDAGAPKRCTSG